MDKNFIIAMVLMLVVFFAWQSFFGPKPPTPEELAAMEEAAQTPAGQPPVDTPAETPAITTPAPPAIGPDGQPIEPAVPAIPVTQKVSIENFTVETNLYKAILSNSGGVIKSFILKDYMDKPGKDAKPFEMVWSSTAGKFAFASEFTGPEVNLPASASYEFVDKSDKRVVFRHVSAGGLETTKIYEFTDDTYVVALKIIQKNIGSSPLQGQNKVWVYAPAEKVSRGFFSAPADFISHVAYIDGSLEKKDAFSVEAQEFPGTEMLWSGFDTNYFMMAVAPEAPKESKEVVSRPNANMVDSGIVSFNKNLIPGETQEYAYTCYMGPKKEDDLEAAGHMFDMSRDFGWFSGIARFLVRVLNFFQKYVKNYGIAIIIVTVIIKIILLPLTQKSYTSMKAMQKVQPEMKEIREKYKDDKNVMNQKMMELYKKHGVNPASGCLPMLVQLPVFIAFYRALYSSIELRHTPFFGWIQDLSAPDPYYVTPILMGGTMFLSQKLTPTSADPMQAKMMMAMPIVFTFLFLNFPSGLVIYWLFNNILTIFQQMYINRKSDEPLAVEGPQGSKGNKK